MKKIIAVVLTFVMFTCTFAIMNNSGVDAKTKSGYYFAMMISMSSGARAKRFRQSKASH